MEIEHFWGAFSLLLLALVAVEIWAAILPKWRPSEQLIREQLILSNHCVSTKQNWKIISETCSACFEPWIELIFRQLMTTFSRKTWVDFDHPDHLSLRSKLPIIKPMSGIHGTCLLLNSNSNIPVWNINTCIDESKIN